MNKEKYIEYFNKLTEQEKVEQIKNISMGLNRLQKQKDKAVEREGNESAYCSRAKRTTLYANSAKIVHSYNEQIEMLKLATTLL